MFHSVSPLCKAEEDMGPLLLFSDKRKKNSFHTYLSAS